MAASHSKRRYGTFILLWIALTILGIALPAVVIVALALATLQDLMPPLTVTGAILLAPGAIGASTGLFQSKALRGLLRRSSPWVIATAIGWLLASFAALMVLFLLRPHTTSHALPLATVFGATVAIPQCVALRRHGPRVAWLIPTTILGILIGGLLLSSLVTTVPYGNGPGEGILQGISMFVFMPISVGPSLGLFTSLALLHVIAADVRPNAA